MVVPVAVFVLIGAFLGTIIMEKLSNSLLRKIFALLLAVVGIQMLCAASEATNDSNQQHSSDAVSEVSAWVLRIGVVSSTLVMLLGMAITFAHGRISVERIKTDTFDYRPTVIWDGILHGEGKRIIEAGIYLLLFTPIMRVFMSFLFLRSTIATAYTR